MVTVFGYFYKRFPSQGLIAITLTIREESAPDAVALANDRDVLWASLKVVYDGNTRGECCQSSVALLQKTPTTLQPDA